MHTLFVLKISVAICSAEHLKMLFKRKITTEHACFGIKSELVEASDVIPLTGEWTYDQLFDYLAEYIRSDEDLDDLCTSLRKGEIFIRDGAPVREIIRVLRERYAQQEADRVQRMMDALARRKEREQAAQKESEQTATVEQTQSVEESNSVLDRLKELAEKQQEEAPVIELSDVISDEAVQTEEVKPAAEEVKQVTAIILSMDEAKRMVAKMNPAQFVQFLSDLQNRKYDIRESVSMDYVIQELFKVNPMAGGNTEQVAATGEEAVRKCQMLERELLAQSNIRDTVQVMEKYCRPHRAKKEQMTDEERRTYNLQQGLVITADCGNKLYQKFGQTFAHIFQEYVREHDITKCQNYDSMREKVSAGLFKDLINKAAASFKQDKFDDDLTSSKAAGILPIVFGLVAVIIAWIVFGWIGLISAGVFMGIIGFIVYRSKTPRYIGDPGIRAGMGGRDVRYYGREVRQSPKAIITYLLLIAVGVGLAYIGISAKTPILWLSGGLIVIVTILVWMSVKEHKVRQYYARNGYTNVGQGVYMNPNMQNTQRQTNYNNRNMQRQGGLFGNLFNRNNGYNNQQVPPTNQQIPYGYQQQQYPYNQNPQHYTQPTQNTRGVRVNIPGLRPGEVAYKLNGIITVYDAYGRVLRRTR